MSKLGFHVSSGNRYGIGECLGQCAAYDSPVALLFALDQDMSGDVAKYSPMTKIIFRTQPDTDDNPPGIYNDDPVACATSWYAKCKPKWLLNKADWYAPLNEPNPTEYQHAWLNAFLLHFITLAQTDGFKIAFYGASAGTPEPTDWYFYRDSLTALKNTGGLLITHEYGLDRGTLQASAPYLALRYRSFHDVIEDMGIHDLPMAITEASSGAGYSAGNDAAWLADVKWYDSELMQDSYVSGACLYQLGGDENFYKLLPDLADYISATPTPIVPPPPVDEWVFSHWLVDGVRVTTPRIQVVMDDNHTVVKVYKKKITPVMYTLTVSTEPAGVGSVKVDPADLVYMPETIVTLE